MSSQHTTSQLVITGDLNLHLDSILRTGVLQTQSACFNDQIKEFGLAQYVSEATHDLGGWLDIVITRDDFFIQDMRVELYLSEFCSRPPASHHSDYLHAQPTYAIKSMRDWFNLDREAFKAGLLNGPLC